jgi:FlaA1/EpsC-like NDP-sugar epimerase
MATNNSVPKKVLVFGATGTIGQHIIREIYNARSSFDKIGIFTSESTAKNKPEVVDDWKKKGVEVIVGDVNSETDVENAYKGVFSSKQHRKQILMSTRLRYRHLCVGSKCHSHSDPTR